MAEQLNTPTPLQLAELVRDLLGQITKADPSTGPAVRERATLIVRTLAMLASVRATAPADLSIIEAARATYTAGTDDIEIDDVPAVVRGDGGAWVAAWLWVADE